jgi:hypothetical protein
MDRRKRPVTRAEALDLARAEMRKSFYELTDASEDFRAITRDIESTFGPDAVDIRTAKKQDPARKDALDKWQWHADNVRTMSAFIQAELAMASSEGIALRGAPSLPGSHGGGM